MNNTIILTGGGTGGHIYPNLALIPELKRRGFDVKYIGGEGDCMESRLAKANGIEYFGLPTVKLVRSLSPKAVINNLSIPRVLSASVKKAESLLRQLSPAAIFSKGGFVSLPAVLAAAKLNIPIFAHESDLTLGLANRIAAKKGATILGANPESKFDCYLVGMPLRDNLFSCTRERALLKLGLDADDYRSTKIADGIADNGRKILLVLGGSSGAQFINSQIESNLDKLLEHFTILHVIGKKNAAMADNVNKIKSGNSKYYKRFEYADDIAAFYAASDVILSRAGATAVYEISALNKRAVFVPLPKGVSRGDQIFNAALAEKYGAVTLCQDEHFSDNLLTSLEKALSHSPMRAISADANGKIADIICATLRRGEICKDKKP